MRRLASQNIINLSTNLGPVMSLTYIVQPLLQQLKSSGNLENVIHTLVCLGAWLGERNIVRYYLPTLFDLLQTHSVKSSRGEPVLIVVLTLIEKVADCSLIFLTLQLCLFYHLFTIELRRVFLK